MDAESYANSIAQFTIPRAAFDVLNVSAIEAWARDGGFAQPRIEATTRDAGGNRIRLTCRLPMADRIIEAIGVALALAEQRSNAALVAELAIARSAALKGRDDALNPRHASMGEQGYTG